MTRPNAGKDVEEMHSKYIVTENVKWYSHPEKPYGNFFKKVNLQLPYDPAMSLQMICRREMKV